MVYPTLKTLTIIDIAKIGVFFDEYQEIHRGTMTREDGRYDVYLAAYRIIRGEPKFDDERLVRVGYENRVREEFTKSGKLPAFLRQAYFRD